MENDELKEIIVKDCNDWINEEELENNIENIKTYISGLYYELADNIDIDREIFRAPKDLSDTDSINYIESQIETILIENLKGKLNNERYNKKGE